MLIEYVESVAHPWEINFPLRSAHKKEQKGKVGREPAPCAKAVSSVRGSFTLHLFFHQTASVRSSNFSVRCVKKCKIIIKVSYIHREVLPFTQAQGVQACSPSAVVFEVCSSAAFWHGQRRYEATQQSALDAAISLMSVWCDRLDLEAGFERATFSKIHRPPSQRPFSWNMHGTAVKMHLRQEQKSSQGKLLPPLCQRGVLIETNKEQPRTHAA